MNEPHNVGSLPNMFNLQFNVAAVIREQEKQDALSNYHLILISGSDYSHLNTWVTPLYSKDTCKVDDPKTCNAAQFDTAFKKYIALNEQKKYFKINPDAKNTSALYGIAIDVHTYGKPPVMDESCTSDNNNSAGTSISQFIKWLNDKKYQAIIGEVGVTSGSTVQDGIDSGTYFFNCLKEQSKLYPSGIGIIGWAFWTDNSVGNPTDWYDMSNMSGDFRGGSKLNKIIGNTKALTWQKDMTTQNYMVLNLDTKFDSTIGPCTLQISQNPAGTMASNISTNTRVSLYNQIVRNTYWASYVSPTYLTTYCKYNDYTPQKFATPLKTGTTTIEIGPSPSR